MAIILASLYGHIAIVNRLLQDNRVDPGDGDNYAIIIASQKGYLTVVNRLLQDKRVNPTDLNNAAISEANHNGHLEIVKILLKDRRVWNSLSSEEKESYLEQIQNVEINS